MGGDQKFQIPDWKSYKIKGIKELEKTQRLLAARGLKDPWIRNEVWRYPSGPGIGGEWKNAAISLGKGLKWAVAAMFVTVLCDSFFSSRRKTSALKTAPEPEEEEEDEEDY